MFNFFKKKSLENDVKYNGVKVDINFDEEESLKHLNRDFKVLENYGIEKIIKKEFLSWLKGEEFKDRDDNKIYDGLKLYEINYHYGKIIEKYSPSGKEGYFGQFEFCFESSSEYTRDILDAVAMVIYVYKGKIIKISGYNI